MPTEHSQILRMLGSHNLDHVRQGLLVADSLCMGDRARMKALIGRAELYVGPQPSPITYTPVLSRSIGRDLVRLIRHVAHQLGRTDSFLTESRHYGYLCLWLLAYQKDPTPVLNLGHCKLESLPDNLAGLEHLEVLYCASDDELPQPERLADLPALRAVVLLADPRRPEYQPDLRDWLSSHMSHIEIREIEHARDIPMP